MNIELGPLEPEPFMLALGLTLLFLITWTLGHRLLPRVERAQAERWDATGGRTERADAIRAEAEAGRVVGEPVHAVAAGRRTVDRFFRSR
ncbi:hypothetical protein [Kitasatospora sp. NPDC058397]|uniref:hypothetical protein n=1 Tax=unclassified Kitasatospora TaxID=2633591 RepID=UPI003667FFBF